MFDKIRSTLILNIDKIPNTNTHIGLKITSYNHQVIQFNNILTFNTFLSNIVEAS